MVREYGNEPSFAQVTVEVHPASQWLYIIYFYILRLTPFTYYIIFGKLQTYKGTNKTCDHRTGAVSFKIFLDLSSRSKNFLANFYNLLSYSQGRIASMLALGREVPAEDSEGPEECDVYHAEEHREQGWHDKRLAGTAHECWIQVNIRNKNRISEKRR